MNITLGQGNTSIFSKTTSQTNPFAAKSKKSSSKDFIASPTARSNRIRRLQQQKKSAAKNRERLIRNTQLRGESLDTIRIKLSQYQMKIKRLDNQISAAIKDETRKDMDKALKVTSSSREAKPDQTKKQLAHEFGFATAMSVTRAVTSARAKLQSEAKHLELDIALERRRGTSEEKLSDQEARLAELQKKMKAMK